MCIWICYVYGRVMYMVCYVYGGGLSGLNDRPQGGEHGSRGAVGGVWGGGLSPERPQ